ncbi:flippase, partial [Lactobacillus reuteri]|uniref:oligosaccharide flippase family protein n=1 Tax=Limosilactobacillus reuteri TaxID=1598 RepID=UPI0016523ACE
SFWEIEALQFISCMVSLVIYLIFVYSFNSKLKYYFILQGLTLIANSIDVSWYFMGLEDFKKTVTKNIIVKILTIILIFLLVKNKNDLGIYIILLNLAIMGGNITLWPYLKHSIKWIGIKKWKPLKHFYSSLLLFIPSITTQVYVIVNKLMLGKISGQTALGEFDYADRIVKLVLALVTSVGMVMLPHIANRFSHGDIKSINQSIYKSFDFVTFASFPLMFGLMAVSQKFAPWFLGSGYVETGKIIFLEAPMIVFVSWSTVTGTQYLVPVKRVREYTISVGIGAVVNIVMNLLLLNALAAKGAALATVISEFTIAILQCTMIKSSISLHILFKEIWKYFLSGIIMFTLVALISNQIKMSFLSLIFEAVIGIVVYIFFILLFDAQIIKQFKNIMRVR